MQKKYPDFSGILAAKAQRRRALAALSWEEKVAIIEQMRKSMPRGMWKDVPKGEHSPTSSPADPPHR